MAAKDDTKVKDALELLQRDAAARGKPDLAAAYGWSVLRLGGKPPAPKDEQRT